MPQESLSPPDHPAPPLSPNEIVPFLIGSKFATGAEAAAIGSATARKGEDRKSVV